MSGNVVSLIALVPMLFHSIFGCCWHHAHFLHDHDHAVTVAVDEASEQDHVHSPHSGGRHSHALLSCAGEEAAHTDGHSPELPPCEDEDRCLHNGMVTTVVTQSLSFDVWDSISVVFMDLHLVQRSQLTVRSDLLKQSLSKSAREHCAMTQVWLV